MRFSAKAKTTRAARRFVPAAVLTAAVFAGVDVDAAEPPIAVGEVTTMPEATGVDPASLRDAAEGEIKQIDPANLPERRRVVVSLSLTRSTAEGPMACSVNAMLRDARTGVMIAIIEAGAQADGPGSPELRRRLAKVAVQNAVRRIPTALAAPPK